MKNKKLILAASALILVATTVAGGTLAYFTSEKTIPNVITTGNVKIDMVEENYDPESTRGIVPGLTVDKDPTVTNIGDNDCYLRVKLETVIYTGETVTNDLAAKPEDLVVLGSNYWYHANDGFYYYKDLLSPADAVTVFETMTIPASWGNSYMNRRLDLVVTAFAIQSDNFTPDRNDNGKIIGWSGYTPNK